MKLSILDDKLVKNYCSDFFEPIKYGENGVFFWFPGAGQTTILKDLLNDKLLQQQILGNIASYTSLVEFWGHVTDKRTLMSLLHESGYGSFDDLKNECVQELQSGNEIVYIVSRIDEYSEKEKLSILKMFVRLNSLNPRRVHILFNSMDRPWFMSALKKHQELTVLIKRMKIMPIVANDLLNEYIALRSEQYDCVIDSEEAKAIMNTYGGVLQLTREYLRTRKDLSILELKVRHIWNVIPKAYREVIQDLITGRDIRKDNDAFNDLEKFGVLHLRVFDKHKNILNIDSDRILKSLVTQEELALWRYCRAHAGELIPRAKVISILRPEEVDYVSFWAVDKAVSRFRKKLSKSGIDPEVLKTVKKKGYIWIV